MLIEIEKIQQLISNVRRFDEKEKGADYFAGWDNAIDTIMLDLKELREVRNNLKKLKIMKNNFSKETIELFFSGGWSPSWETGINNSDCLHHILGRVSNSPYNAAPLNNFLDHMPEGRKELLPLSSQIVISKYLKKTKKYLDAINYKPNKKDLEFLEKYKKYYENSSLV